MVTLYSTQDFAVVVNTWGVFAEVLQGPGKLEHDQMDPQNAGEIRRAERARELGLDVPIPEPAYPAAEIITEAEFLEAARAAWDSRWWSESEEWCFSWPRLPGLSIDDRREASASAHIGGGVVVSMRLQTGSRTVTWDHQNNIWWQLVPTHVAQLAVGLQAAFVAYHQEVDEMKKANERAELAAVYGLEVEETRP
jgi:hypothetical protein